MKKYLKGLSIAMLVLVSVCALAFAGCDKSGSIQKAFENEGYTVTSVDTKNEQVQAVFTLVGLTDDQKQEIGEYSALLCVNGVNVAVVVKFPSEDKIKEFLSTEDSTAAYDKAKENNLINGNCYLLTVSSGAKTIFKNA